MERVGALREVAIAAMLPSYGSATQLRRCYLATAVIGSARVRRVVVVSHPGPITWDEVQSWPARAGRYESFAGVLTMTPSPTGRHQLAVATLLDVLRHAAPPELLVLPAPYDWWVSPTEWYEPDIVVFEQSHFDPEGPLRQAPMLVVEVTSPSTRIFDLNAKRAAYSAHGCPMYWVVDPDEPSLLALHLVGTSYVEEARVAGNERFKTATPFDVTVVPSALVRH